MLQLLLEVSHWKNFSCTSAHPSTCAPCFQQVSYGSLLILNVKIVNHHIRGKQGMLSPFLTSCRWYGPRKLATWVGSMSVRRDKADKYNNEKFSGSLCLLRNNRMLQLLHTRVQLARVHPVSPKQILAGTQLIISKNENAFHCNYSLLVPT